MEYFESDLPRGSGLCSDNACPCDETVIPRGGGYLYIEPSLVEFRRKYPRLQAAQEAREQQLGRQHDAIGFGASFTSYRIGPVLMCEQGARLRNLDLGVAAADAKQWWETGQVPLRATPIKGGASPPPDEGLSEITLAAGPASKPSREKADRSPELESAKHQPDPDHYACVAKILQMTKLAQQELLKRSGLTKESKDLDRLADVTAEHIMVCKRIWSSELLATKLVRDSQGLRLQGADFAGLLLVSPDLAHAQLQYAFLENTIWMFGSLKGADLTGASLKKASLSWVSVSGCCFRHADLSNADFSQLVFDERGLDFTNATLVGTKMNLSDSGAATTSAGLNFTNADLTEAELTLSVTQAPIFTGARMKHCKLLLPEGLDVQHRLSSEQRSQTTITRSSTREESKQPTKSGCFIAAAVYGHADCPQVLVLRRFRDEVLARTFLGRAGICVYYHLGPMAAQWLNQKPGLMRAIRRVLDWCVKSIQSKRDFLRT